MGALKNLAIETEELFSSNNFWTEWTKVEDHGLTMYAFSGSRWSWSGDLHHENTHRTVTEPYYLGGEGMRGDSPLFCLECAVAFSTATGLEQITENKFANPDDPNSVYIEKHAVSRTEKESLMICPCSNALFAFYDTDTMLDGYSQREITEGQFIDLVYLNGYYEGVLSPEFVEYCQPLFDMREES